MGRCIGYYYAAFILSSMLKESGYFQPVGGNAPGDNRSISKDRSTAALGTPRLVQIDPEGRQVDEWKLHNSYLANVDFGQLSYNEDSLVTYTLTITYDFASYSKAVEPGSGLIPVSNNPAAYPRRPGSSPR